MTQPQDISPGSSQEKLVVKSPLRRHSLVNASKQELEQAALNFIEADNLQFKVLGDTPKVVLSRLITLAELNAIDLGGFDPIAEVPPLALVVLKGNFDATNFVSTLQEDGTLKPSKEKYVAYVVDLRAGVPTLTAVGLTGEYFRQVLDNPTIPDQPKQLIGPEPGQPKALPGPRTQNLPKLPYGGILPSGSKPKRPNSPS